MSQALALASIFRRTARTTLCPGLFCLGKKGTCESSVPMDSGGYDWSIGACAVLSLTCHADHMYCIGKETVFWRLLSEAFFA